LTVPTLDNCEDVSGGCGTIWRYAASERCLQTHQFFVVLANVLINSAVDYLDMLGNFVEVDLGAALVATVRSRVLRDDLASELDCFETILQKRRGKRVPLKAGEAFRCTNRSRRRWRRTHSLWGMRASFLFQGWSKAKREPEENHPYFRTCT
jgi:hypothetical protein